MSYRIIYNSKSNSSVGACVADTNAHGTMHNFEEYAIVIQKNDGAIFLKINFDTILTVFKCPPDTVL